MTKTRISEKEGKYGEKLWLLKQIFFDIVNLESCKI